MKKYQITFYVHGTDKPIAAALAVGKSPKEAGDNAYKFLNKKYPSIRPGEWISIEISTAASASLSPVEVPYDELTYGQP